MAPLQQSWQAQTEHGQYQTRATWWMAIRLQQQPLTLQAILHCTGTVSADITPPVVALDDVLTNDSTPALTGTVNDPTATVVVNVDGADYPAVNNGDGTWTPDNTLPALTDGPHTIP